MKCLFLTSVWLAIQVYQACCKQLQATVAVKKLDLDTQCDLVSAWAVFEVYNTSLSSCKTLLL